MHYICGPFQIKHSGEFRFYSDLDEYVTGSGVEGILLGEDAEDFISFYAMDVCDPFDGTDFRIGTILGYGQDMPIVCPIHQKASLAIGINDSVWFVDLHRRSVVARVDSWCGLHHFLCNGNVLAAIHELGASVIRLSNFQEIAVVEGDVVAGATLSSETLEITTIDKKITRIDLTAAFEEK